MVEVGRREQRVPSAAYGVPALLVGDDEEQIGPSIIRTRRCRESEGYAEEEEISDFEDEQSRKGWGFGGLQQSSRAERCAATTTSKGLLSEDGGRHAQGESISFAATTASPFEGMPL